MVKENSYVLAGLSGLMLILSYLFFLNDSSGSAPLILLFAGLIIAAVLVFSALITIRK